MKYLFVLLVLLFTGCSDPPITPQGETVKYGLQIGEINGCQYVILVNPRGYNDAAMVHAGNCNNPIHSYTTK